MTWLDALLLGLIEGITEFLPISSTGHLILASRAMGLSGDLSDAFDVAIQSGAILAVVLLRRERFMRLLPHAPSGPLSGLRGLFNLSLLTLPALIVGFVLRHPIKERLFGPQPVAAAMLVGGLAILALDRERQGAKGLDDLSARDALCIGLVQCLALWPGMSRSACSILGALGLGYGRGAATELSFVAAVPILLAATGYEAVAHGSEFAEAAPLLGIGLLGAFAAALVAVKGLLALLKKTTLRPFGWYRVCMSPLFWLYFK